MRPSDPFGWFLLLGGGTATVIWTLILGPVLIRSASRNGHVLSLAALYVAGLASPLAFLVDPTEESARFGLVEQAALVLALGVGAAAVLGGLSRGGRPHAVGVTLVGYLLVVSVSGVLNGAVSLALVAMPLLAAAVVQARLEPERLVTHLRYITRVTTLGSLALAVWAYSLVSFTENGRQLLGFDQLSGATPHPNVLGPFAAFALAVELAPGRRRRSAIGIAAALTVCLLAQSRAGWVCAVLVLLLWLVSSRSRRVALSLLGYGGLLAGLGWLVSRAFTGQPLIPVDLDELLTGRLEVWRISLEPFWQSPLIGDGPQVFDEDFRATHGAIGTVIGQAHNQILETLAEAGLLGLLAFLTLCVAWLAAARRTWRAGSWLPAAAVLLLTLDSLVESPLREALLLPTFIVLSTAAILRSHVGAARRSSAGGHVPSGSCRSLSATPVLAGGSSRWAPPRSGS